MSRFAFKRDSEDPQTIQDFVAIVQSPERLKLLLLPDRDRHPCRRPQCLERLEGPALRELYQEAAAAMATGDPQGRRARRIERAKQKLGEALAALRTTAAGDRTPISPATTRATGLASRPRSICAAHRRASGRRAGALAVDFLTDEFRAHRDAALRRRSSRACS